jgi:AraC family transcriptional regulator
MTNTPDADLAPPRIETRDAFTVAGLAARYSQETASTIPAQWDRFAPRAAEIQDVVPGAVYGVCYDGDGQGQFDYMSGLAVSRAESLPEGMTAVRVPAGRYAVFTHSGNIADFSKTVHAVWNGGLADAGVGHRPAPDFERYDERFDPKTGDGEVEIWIPIK